MTARGGDGDAAGAGSDVDRAGLAGAARSLWLSGWAAISDGFAEVNGDKVVLMVDSCEFARDIDTARAERAKANAERVLSRLESAEREEASYRMAEAALQRALIRIQVAGKQHSL